LVKLVCQVATMFNTAQRIEEVNEKIAYSCDRSGRAVSEVKLVIVTKTADLDSIKEVIKLGYTDLGENRVQQLKRVCTEVADFLADGSEDVDLPAKVNWHMIGHLQRNKVRQVLPITCMIHSIDTLRLAEEISSVAARLELSPRVLLQVNTSGEPQKYGVPAAAATHMAEQIATLPNLKLAGLMTMAPLTRNKDVVRACFERTRDLFEEIRGEKLAGEDFTELSMGMSSDYEIAVEEGATILRIGSAIFAG